MDSKGPDSMSRLLPPRLSERRCASCATSTVHVRSSWLVVVLPLVVMGALVAAVLTADARFLAFWPWALVALGLAGIVLAPAVRWSCTVCMRRTTKLTDF